MRPGRQATPFQRLLKPGGPGGEDLMTGATISVPARDGASFKAYLATPEYGSGPGIVLLQEIFGINQYIRDANPSGGNSRRPHQSLIK